MDFVRRENLSLVVIDMQERLMNAIPERKRKSIIKSAAVLIEAAKTFEVPITVTEQYPRGLGPTIHEIKDCVGDGFKPIEKVVFSCARSPEFKSAIEKTHKREALICGIETHVCVLQTVIDMINGGYVLYVPADAVASRKDLDWEKGICLIEKAGAVVGTTEAFVFQLLERAGTDEFKTISKLLK
jgi:nicotinamidase-related amidase